MAYFESRVHPFVKAFIISDALLYSSLNIVNILFALYVTLKVPGGTVQSATTVIAAGFAARIVVELSAGRRSSKLTEKGKLRLIVAGMIAISLSYAGFALSHNIWALGGLWILNGAGWALAHPAKLALVAGHINPEQGSQEWGLTDALNMALIIVTMAIGAYVVTHISYSIMFWLAAVINTIGIIPYFVYSKA